MEKQILELLLELKQEVKEMKAEFKKEVKDINTKLDKLDFQMRDGFETIEIKIDEVDLKLRKSNKKLSEQIASNMESIESLKTKH